MTGTSLVSRMNGLLPRREDLFAPFESHFNKLFDEFFNDGSLASIKGRAGYPKIDVITENGKWIIEAALPGVDPKDVKVEVVPYDEGRDVLILSGQMSEDRQYSNDAHYHVKELRRSAFERRVILPNDLIGEPEALMKDGILKLTWKVPEKQVPERKQIQVKTE